MEFNFFQKLFLMCRYYCPCSAVVDQDALVDPLGVGDLQELCDETGDPPCSAGGRVAVE